MHRLGRETQMRRQDEFFEDHSPRRKMDIIIAAVAIVTLLLTGTLFASKTNAEVSASSDTGLYESYLNK